MAAFGVGIAACGCLALVAVFMVATRVTDANKTVGEDDVPALSFQFPVRK